MTNEEILKKFPKPTSKEYELKFILNTNYKPHPYCITEKHLGGDSMYLGNEEIREMEAKGVKCGMYTSLDGKQIKNGYKAGWSPCEVSYDEHTSDKVLFLKALVDKEVKNLKKLKEYLKSIAPLLKKYKLEGVGFIAPDKKDDSK